MGNILSTSNQNDFTTWTPNPVFYSVITPGGGVAPDGSSPADIIGDNGPSDVVSFGLTFATPANTLPYNFALYIKKTTGATTFPDIELRYPGATIYCGVVLNTDTGAFVARATSGVFTPPDDMGVRSYNADYWIVWLMRHNASQTSVALIINPAFNSDASGGYNVASEGSATVWGAWFEQASVPSFLTPPSLFSVVFNVGAIKVPSGSTIHTNNITSVDDMTVTWDWNWGDGSTHSTTKNPSHVFSTPGTYTITLTGTRASDSVVGTWSIIVTITGRNKPRFATDNILRHSGVTITVSAETVSGPHEYAYDNLEATHWVPGITGDAWLRVTGLGGANQASYFAIFAHNLGLTGTTAKLQTSPDGTTWTDVPGSSMTPIADECIYKPFAQVAPVEYRVYLTGCTPSTMIGVISFGVDFATEHGFGSGFTPPDKSRDNIITNNQAQNGAFLGRTFVDSGSLINPELKWMSQSWTDTYWVPFVKSIEKAPFFLLWNDTEYPDVACWGWTEGTISPVSYDQQSYLTVTLAARVKLESK